MNLSLNLNSLRRVRILGHIHSAVDQRRKARVNTSKPEMTKQLNDARKASLLSSFCGAILLCLCRSLRIPHVTLHRSDKVKVATNTVNIPFKIAHGI